MNISVYIYGDLSSGYTQYPDEDFSSSIFQKLQKYAKAETQIAIHRDGNLMYYAYLRKLQSNKYIGFCVLVNGIVIVKIDEMFCLFENIISNLVTIGSFVKYDKYGNIVANAEKLYLKPQEIDLVTNALKVGFDKFQSTSQKLPPEDYAVNVMSAKEFSSDDNTEEILKSSYTNGFTYIYKSDGYDTTQMDSFKGVLSGITKEKERLEKEVKKLKIENDKIEKQKKQFRNVVILFVLLLGCGIGLLLINNSLNITQSQLDNAIRTIGENNEIISDQKNKIEKMSSQIKSLQSSLSSEKYKRKEAEGKLGSFSSSIPLIITDIEIANVYNDGSFQTEYGSTIYSSSSMYLMPKITYIGIRDGESITLNTKLYGIAGTLISGNSSPSGYSFSNSLTVYSGSGNTYELSGWGGQNKGYFSRGTYRYEIWYDNKCLGSKTFFIY